MLLPGTQMHIVTFLFVSIEIVIFFYLIVYRLARPDDKTAYLNVILISLLIAYNLTGGLLPDKNLPGSYFFQMSIAYATGFITPCFFPYYVYKAFGLEKMKFHAYKGVFLFLVLPYLIFVALFAISGNLEIAKNLLVLPVLYAVWVIFSLTKSIKYKYKNSFKSRESKEEIAVLFLSLTPWVGLPVIDFFNMGQAIEASITNVGFLLLMALQVKRNIQELRTQQEQLKESGQRLLDWNANLKTEVEKRTKELERINEQKTNTFVNLAHETKTPLTLINNYLDEYIANHEESKELNIVKKGLNKLSADIVNFFDLEKFDKGFAVYNHELVSDVSEILNDCILLFKPYAGKRNIEIVPDIGKELLVKADPLAINRVITNLLENAVKFSNEGGKIEIILTKQENLILLTIKDYGSGIPTEQQKKVFEPYYQITSQKKSTQGMGLGLPIVKKVIDDLEGEIKIFSNPKKEAGTKIVLGFKTHDLKETEIVTPDSTKNYIAVNSENNLLKESEYNANKQTILIVEDNITMLNYLQSKLTEKYNVYAGVNGNDALKKLKSLTVIPDLIISDVMMDKLDGFSFAKILSNEAEYNFIPFIFLTAKASYNDKQQGLKLGAIDYIQKPFSISELQNKIEAILLTASKQKKAVLSRAFNALNSKETLPVKNSGDAFEKNCQLNHLTAREKEIAKLICQGFKYKDIGETLFIAERTVTKHAQNIFEKAGVSSKVELMNKLEFS